ncbi:hypothetical protein BGZ98_004132, partial [Dissophora globulifera]
KPISTTATVPAPLSALSNTSPSPSTGSSPSLTQLATASNRNTGPRRSLVSLAKPSLASSSSLSPPTPSAGSGRLGMGLGACTGSGGGSLVGLGEGELSEDQRPLGRTQGFAASSTSLSSVTSTSSQQQQQQQRSSRFLTDLSTRSSERTTTYTQDSIAKESSRAPGSDPTIQSNTATPESNQSSSLLSLLAPESTPIPATPSDMPTGDASQPEPFLSLIARPSHFALSIFERLDPVPSPIAVSTATVLKTDPALLHDIMRSTGESINQPRMFRFDGPSPDDIVFKMQGQRPIATRT